MPRRKRTFIHRANANNFQVVHRPTAEDPNRHELESSDKPGAEVSQTHGNVIDDGEYEYAARDYELGEYGFPDDGYDYSQHFRTIGGGGGVFIDAQTGLPNPDAVVRTSAPVTKKEVLLKNEFSDTVTLRESSSDITQTEDNERINMGTERLAFEDSHMYEKRMKAIEDIRQARRQHDELNYVFTLLDSDGELESIKSNESISNVNQQGDEVTQTASANTTDDTFDDDFITKANAAISDENNNVPNGDEKPDLHGVLPKFREPRLLDAQFDEFMREYNRESSEDDEELEQLKETAQRCAANEDSAETLHKLLTENELNGLGFDDNLDESDLLGAFSGLRIETDIANDQKDNSSACAETELVDLSNTEFERGMDGVLDSYARVEVNEALYAEDGIDGARRAAQRLEAEQREQLERMDELGIESDGHDSDLDTLFDEMYKDKDERWDCETILTTYSNLENHPSVIDAPVTKNRKPERFRSIIQLDPRTQAPAEHMPSASRQSTTGPAVDYGSRNGSSTACTERPRQESKEAKKARKAAVKEAARERRAAKGEMKKAFGAEQLKQTKHSASLGEAKIAVKF